MPWTIAQKIDLLTLQEMVMARAVPNPMFAFAAVAVCAMGETIYPGLGIRDSGFGAPTPPCALAAGYGEASGTRDLGVRSAA